MTTPTRELVERLRPSLHVFGTITDAQRDLDLMREAASRLLQQEEEIQRLREALAAVLKDIEATNNLYAMNATTAAKPPYEWFSISNARAALSHKTEG